MRATMLLFFVLVTGCVLTACGSHDPVCPPGPTPPGNTPPVVHSPPPVLRLPDDAAPRRYRASLEIDPSAATFVGHIEIDVTVKHAVDAVWLNAHELDIARAVLRRDGRDLPLAVQAQPRNFVALAGAVPGGDATLVLDYTGKQAYGRPQGMGRYIDAGDDYAVTHFEPNGARRVFPCFDEPSFKVPWQLTVTVPAGRTAFTNTAVTTRDALPDGRQRFAFAATRPLPSYLIAVAVGPYETVDAGRSRTGVPMRIVVPHGRGRDARIAAAEVGKILAALEDYTGIPYGYDKLDHIVVPGTPMGAMEHPGLVTYGSRWLLIRDGEGATARQGQVSIVAHELAHQWFGNLVTNAWWDDLWLNEAFASWLGPRTIEAVHPEMDGAIERVKARVDALAADVQPSARRIRQPIVDEADMRAAFDGITYSKGATVIAMFERWLGPDVFRTGARTYLATHADGNATAADFLAALAKVTDKPVATAFSTFLDQPGAPQIDMQLVCEAGKRPRIELAQRRLAYKNARPTNAPAGSPSWHVPVCVRAQGRHTPSCMLLDRPTGVLELGAADPDPHGFARREAPPPGLDTACPDYVIPNAGGAGYYVANLPGDLFGRALDRGNPSRAEQLALLFDLGMLTETGQIDASGLLARTVALGTSEDPYVAEIAAGALIRFARMVRAGQRDVFAALVRDALGKRAGTLGWLPRLDEPVSEAQLRGRVMALVTVEGGDGPARERVLALARQWLADPASLPESSWTSILVTAVRVAPETVMPRLFDKLPAVTDRLQQRAIYNALGAAPDRANQARALALLEGTGPVPVEKLEVLRALPYDVELQAAQFAFVRDRKDELLRRIPRDYLGALRIQVCDAAHRDEVAAYLRSLAGNPDIGAIAIAHDIDAMDQCISRHAMQAPVLEKFLADRRHR